MNEVSLKLTKSKLGNSTINGSFSFMEEKLGIFFASCPMIRQLLAYIQRHRTLRPTRDRIPPNADFLAMRKRIELRDIFWYRQPPTAELPRSNDRNNTPRADVAKPIEVKYSGLDHIWIKLKAALGRGKMPRGIEVERMAVQDDFSDDDGSKRPTHASSPVVQKDADNEKYKETFLLSRTQDVESGAYTRSSAYGSPLTKNN